MWGAESACNGRGGLGCVCACGMGACGALRRYAGEGAISELLLSLTGSVRASSRVCGLERCRGMYAQCSVRGVRERDEPALRDARFKTHLPYVQVRGGVSAWAEGRDVCRVGRGQSEASLPCVAFGLAVQNSPPWVCTRVRWSGRVGAGQGGMLHPPPLRRMQGRVVAGGGQSHSAAQTDRRQRRAARRPAKFTMVPRKEGTPIDAIR